MTTVLEILSNEILMQLFEYLDAYHLFKAFLDLNFRFNCLLEDRYLYLKFNSKYIRNNAVIDGKMWTIMMNHLTAITLINDKHIRMFMLVCKESDLMCLHSMTLRRVHISKEKSSVVKYISKLKSLKNLRIQALNEIHDLTLMIICINALPELKSYECTNPDCQTAVIFTWPEQTNIEDLTIECVFYGLSNILLQTPKLKYLNVNLINYGPAEFILTDAPLPLMKDLIHLKMQISFVSFNHLSDLMQSMPNLKSLELSGASMGENIDNGYKLKHLFGHLQEVILENLQCLTSASSANTILATFNDDMNGFWSDVTCSIEYNRAYLSAFGHAR